jgi:hypothetical protein
MYLDIMIDDLYKIILYKAIEFENYKDHKNIDVLNLANILVINKHSFIILKELYKNIIKKKIKFFKSYNIDNGIIEIFGGYLNMTKIPYLNFRKNFIGPTQYIDNICSYHLKSPIMFSIDNYNRLLFSFKLKIKHLDNLMLESKSVTTLFQRYTGGNTWVYGNFYKESINDTLYFKIDDVNIFKSIIARKTIQKEHLFFNLDI